ncbi:MAG: MFS transporter [Alistipes sp.]|nr:MFS transporter [Alistipes sp.]
MKINTGKGNITLITLIAIWSVSAVTSLPGLAVSPILGDMNNIFPKASDLEIQMLTSLPSLLIIPFVLLAGRLSTGRDKLPMLYLGLAIFTLCGVACLVAKSMTALIIISSILGIGAGMIIPLSTGLVVDYFTGDFRVKQLGYSSAINNLTLVGATALTGYVADINWHLSFLVYLLPGVSLLLCLALRRESAAAEPIESDQYKQQGINKRHLAVLTLFYFVITFASLVVTFDTAFLFEKYKIRQELAGVSISLFFLAIMLPGLFLSHIIKYTRSYTNVISTLLLTLGLLSMTIFKSPAMLVIGVILSGFGYGIMQPLIYDKAAIIAPPHLATQALSIVMAANYIAIILCPFIIDAVRKLFATQSISFSFGLCAVVAAVTTLIAFIGKSDFALGLDKSYYSTKN